MRWNGVAALLLFASLSGAALAADAPLKLAERLADEVRELNESHAKKPGTTLESELAKRVSKRALQAADKLIELEDSGDARDALVTAGEAALDLDLMEPFERIYGRLAALDPARANELGVAVSREQFIVRGVGGLDEVYCIQFADVVERVMTAYDDVFGFTEWSKVPGKKLRFRVRLVEKIERPPHFAPQFPFHSEVDFPVADAKELRSPTPDGKFQFYGLCHELGHVIAMWGNRKNQEDHHAWAHYTGVVIVEHLAKRRGDKKWMKNLRDARSRSTEVDRKRLEEEAAQPSRASRDGVLTLLYALHDSVGPKAIGTAINHLDAEDKRLRINHVRYYTFDELREGLLATLKRKKRKQAVRELLD